MLLECVSFIDAI